MLEDDKGDMAYNGTVQAQRASYFVMVRRAVGHSRRPQRLLAAPSAPEDPAASSVSAMYPVSSKL